MTADEHPRYLFVGQLIERKGLRQLLEAFARLERGHLWLVGDGPLRHEVEQAASANAKIRSFGHLGAHELDGLYAAADVLVLPSLYEVWGLVVNEALQHGLPVIATTQTGAVDDLVVPGVTGVVVEAGSVDDLGAAMAAAGAWSPEQRRRCAAKASRILERWSMDAQIRGFIRAAELACEHRR